MANTEASEGLMMLAGISEQPSTNNNLSLTPTTSPSTGDSIGNAELCDMVLSKESINLVSTRKSAM